jgi:[ribosomal protein S18]-alanine N-acetyltransferase
MSLFGGGFPILLRRASTADAAECARLHGLAFRQNWSEVALEQMLAEQAVLGHVVVRSGPKGAPVILEAFVLSRQAADEAEIITITVDPASRRLGHGRRLLNHHRAALERFGVSRLFLEVNENNFAARSLYERSGFAEVGRRAGYYPQPDGRAATALVMRHDAV